MSAVTQHRDPCAAERGCTRRHWPCPLGRAVQSRARGFTLIEMLVALLVLSIGLLGIAALQLTSLRSNHSAAMRSQATLLAYDIVDRMRANRGDAITGDYDIALGATPSGTSVADDDLKDWETNLTDTLGPTAKGSVNAVQDATDASTTTVTVQIQWDDSNGDAGSASNDQALTFVLETQI